MPNANLIQDYHRKRYNFPDSVGLDKYTLITSLENKCNIIRKYCFGTLSLYYINNRDNGWKVYFPLKFKQIQSVTGYERITKHKELGRIEKQQSH